jgi:molecular chaperone GrpE
MSDRKTKKEPAANHVKRDAARKAAGAKGVSEDARADADGAEAVSEKARADAEGAKDAPEEADAAADAGAVDSSGEQASGEQGEDGDARYMRLAADFQNYKKRTEKEKSDIYAYANEKFALGLLDVIDNFERAIGQDAASGEGEKFIEGMKLIMDQLIGVLERNDVAEMDVQGSDFDPVLHHAVQTEASTEYGSGKVTKVLQKGYTIRDKVLRPAMVIVAE